MVGRSEPLKLPFIVVVNKMSHLCSRTVFALRPTGTAQLQGKINCLTLQCACTQNAFWECPCPVLIPSCSGALSESLWQGLSEFRPKCCQTCAETAGELQPCSQLCLCSCFWSKLPSLALLTCVRDDITDVLTPPCTLPTHICKVKHQMPRKNSTHPLTQYA